MTLQTDENGCIRFRGFYGDYALQLGNDAKTSAAFKLSAKDENCLLVTLMR